MHLFSGFIVLTLVFWAGVASAAHPFTVIQQLACSLPRISAPSLSQRGIAAFQSELLQLSLEVESRLLTLGKSVPEDLDQLGFTAYRETVLCLKQRRGEVLSLIGREAKSSREFKELIVKMSLIQQQLILLSPLHNSLALVNSLAELKSILVELELHLSPKEALKLIEQIGPSTWEDKLYVLSFVSETPTGHPEEQIEKLVVSMKPALAGEYEELTQKEALYFLVELVWKQAIDMAKLGRLGKIKDLEQSISNLETTINTMTKAGRNEQATALKHRLERHRNFLEILNVSGASGLRSGFEYLESVLNAEGFTALAKQVWPTLGELTKRNQNGVLWFGLTLKEGDIVLEVENQGYGTLFHSVIGLSPLFGHTLVVGRHEEEGIPIYFLAEINDTVSLSTLWSRLSEKVIVRPKYELKFGFTSEALNHLENRSVLFDTSFEIGLYNSSGELSLYCSEFIHLLFSTGFSEQQSEVSSPFEFVDWSLPGVSPQLERNLRLAGVSVREGYLVPDRLFENPMVSWVGSRLVRSTSTLTDSGLYSRVQKELMEMLNRDVKGFYSSLHLKQLGFFEKKKMDSLIYLGQKFEKIPSSVRYLPRDDARYYLFGLYKVREALYSVMYDQALLYEGEGESASQIMPAKVLPLYKEAYEEQVLPKLFDLFY